MATMNIDNIPFNPLHTKEELDAAKNFLIQKRVDFAGTGNYGIVFTDLHVSGYTNMFCHRDINRPTTRTQATRTLVATENGTRRSKKSNETVEGFLQWFLFESYFGKYIVEKDLDFCRNYGFVISADVAAPLLQNICIVTRHFYEVGGSSFKKFDELRLKGVDPLIAYPLCFNSNWSHGYPSLDNAVRSVSGHRAHPLFNEVAWGNWLRGDLGKATKLSFTNDKEHYRYNHDYNGGLKFFFDSFTDSYTYETCKGHFIYELIRANEDFRNALSIHRKGGVGGGYRPPNPFVRPAEGEITKPADNVSLGELWDFALPWMLEHGIFDSYKEGTSNVKAA